MNKYHFFWKGPLSQWKTSYFVDKNGVEYNCCEKFMMAGKALLFNDLKSYNKIMLSDSPKDIQQYGREVKNFDLNVWNLNAKSIVFVGNYLKFSQNFDLRVELFATEGTTIVEASPFDSVWGIKMGEDNPDRFDETKWKGTNWLGEVLTNVREVLKKVYSGESEISCWKCQNYNCEDFSTLYKRRSYRTEICSLSF